MSKAAMNLQDSFLNQVRRENSEVRVLLVNGTLLRGTVKGFDNFTLILNNRNGQHLIYKHAVAQIVTHRPHLKNDELHPNDESPHSEHADTDSHEISSSDEKAPQQEASSRQDATEGEKPAKPNAPRGDRPARTHAPQGDRPPRQNTPQGDRPPRNNTPQASRPSRTNAPAPQGADNAPRQKPKKEGFNTLDLSSVKLEETKTS